MKSTNRYYFYYLFRLGSKTNDSFDLDDEVNRGNKFISHLDQTVTQSDF